MAALQASIDSSEQPYWLASLRLDPPEEERADVRFAVLAAVLTGRRPEDFYDGLPWHDRPAVEPVALAIPQAALRRKLDAVMAMLGGKR